MFSANKSFVFIAVLLAAPAYADYSVGYLSILANSPDPGVQELSINNVTGAGNCYSSYPACSSLDFTAWTLTVNYSSDYYSPGTPGTFATGSFVYQDGVNGATDIGPGYSSAVFDFNLCAIASTCSTSTSPDTTITSVLFSGQISSGPTPPAASFCLYDSGANGCNGTTVFPDPYFSLVWNSGSPGISPAPDASDPNPYVTTPYVDGVDTYAESPDITVTQSNSVTTPEPAGFLLVTALLPFAFFARRLKSGK